MLYFRYMATYSPEFRDELSKAQDLFVWESPDREAYPRSRRWYYIMAGIAIALLVYAVLTANYLFAFIIILTAIILVLAGNEEPRNVLVQVGPNGVVYDGKLYAFDEISQFAILYQPPDIKILYIQPRNIINSRMRIELDEQDPISLRNHLKQYVQEDLDLQSEHLSDIFGRLLKI
jgi:hypothetical protein